MPLEKKPKLPIKPILSEEFASLRRTPDGSGGSVNRSVRLLELTTEERERLEATDALIIDGAGRECFRGLSIAESLEFLTLRRLGLSNEDSDFLRLIELGDLHAASQSRLS